MLFIVFIFQHTIDEVEQLIRKHEAFEKSALAQKERFDALERLTTVNHFFFSPTLTLDLPNAIIFYFINSSK